VENKPYISKKKKTTTGKSGFQFPIERNSICNNAVFGSSRQETKKENNRR